VYNYVLNNGGWHTEESYPYKGWFPSKGYTQPCQDFNTSIGAKVAPGNNSNPYVWLAKNETVIKQFIATKGPVVGTICARTQAFMHWGTQVMMASDCACDDSNHYIQIVGYGFKDTIPVWIIKNSWGTRWGTSGYLYLQRGVDNPCQLYHQLIAPIAA